MINFFLTKFFKNYLNHVAMHCKQKARNFNKIVDILGIWDKIIINAVRILVKKK
jgi:hypothetical protein